MCSRSVGFTMRASRAAVDKRQVATLAGSTAGEALQRLTTSPVKPMELAQCVKNSMDFWEIEVNTPGIYGRPFVFWVHHRLGHMHWIHLLLSQNFMKTVMFSVTDIFLASHMLPGFQF